MEKEYRIFNYISYNSVSYKESFKEIKKTSLS